MTAWTGQAQLLADALREPGYGAAESNARAWKARVLPEATRGLVTAAMVLTDGEAGGALWSSGESCPDDTTLLGWVSDLEGHIGELLKHCQDMTATCTAELDRAVTEQIAASAEARSAQARMAAASTPDAHAAAEHDYQLAAERVRAAVLVIADCEAATEILGAAGAKLGTALNAVRQVPADLRETYETPYMHVHEYGPLPRDGDFLTGVPA